MHNQASAGHRFLLVLLILAIGLLVLVVAPFAGSLFAAVVLAVVLDPLHRRTTAAFGGRTRLAALTVTLGLSVAVLLPLAWLTMTMVRQVVETADSVATTIEEKGVDGLVLELPTGLQPLARRLQAWLPQQPHERQSQQQQQQQQQPQQQEQQQPQEQQQQQQQQESTTRPEPMKTPPPASGGTDLGSVIGSAASMAKSLLARLAALFVDTGVLIVALFCMLAQGHMLVRWVVTTVPLPKQQTENFLAELHDVTVAVFVSTVTTAVIQAAVAGIGYWIAGIPQFPVALMVTLIAAFIPAIGGATVTVVIGLLLLATGDTGFGIFLVVWGLLPVALCDNLVTPLLAQRRLHLPGAVIFFAMLGGLVMLGPMGVVAGPLIVSFFLVVVRALKSTQHGTRTSRTAAKSA